MKTLSSVLFIFIAIINVAIAKTVYVTDNLNLSLRSDESTHGKVIKLLPSGTPMEVLSENKKTGFSRVRLQSGEEGYFLTRSTMTEPPSRFQLEAASKSVASLQADNARLKAELLELKKNLTPNTSLEQSLANERDRLNWELAEIKKTAASSVQIKEERDELQEQLINVERELEQYKLDNQSLKDSTEQDWFLYGGGVAFLGILLGFMLPKLAWRRRPGGWDTIN